MKREAWSRTVGATMLVLLALAGGCSSESRAARRIARADHYFGQGEYQEATIEYRNALRADPDNRHAIRRLGLAFYELGEFRQAFAFLRRASEDDPADLDIRLKLGRLYLAGGAPAESKAQAEAVLAASPTNLAALVLLLDTAATTNELRAVSARLRAGHEQFKSRAIYHAARAKLHLFEGHPDKAEQAYLEARAADPENAASHLALATFYVQARRLDEAAHSYQRAAELAPENAAIQARWASFLLQRGNADEARKIAETALETRPGDRLCLLTLAKVALSERKLDECEGLLKKALESNPSDVDALLVRVAVALARGQTGAAVGELEGLVRRYPKSASLRRKLASARLRNRDVVRAKQDLEACISLAPDAVQPRLMLAELQVRTGDAETAVRGLLEVLNTQPDLAAVHTLMGTAYGTLGRHGDAVAAFRRAAELQPDNPAHLYMLGVSLHRDKKLDEAENAFLRVLEQRPEFMPALAQLVGRDMARKQPEAAIARLKTASAAQPESGRIHYLLGRVYAVEKRLPEAEPELQQAIALDPDLSGAYRVLANIYAATDRQDEALAKLENALAVNQRDVAAWMMAALLLQQQGRDREAAERYEKALEIAPRFLPAANNLAYLYNEKDATRDRAFDLAMAAHERVPDNGYVADTLAWILFHRKEHKWAYRLLQTSLEQLGNRHEVLYHYAVVAAALGKEADARQALTTLAGEDPAGGQQRAAARLAAVLAIDPDARGPAGRATLEAYLADYPTSAPALLRMARLQEQDGKPDEARKTYETAIAANPHFLPAYLDLIDSLLSTKATAGRALAVAETVKTSYPTSAEALHRLGWAAYHNRQHARAAAVLRDAAGQAPRDALLHYRLGVSLHAAGQVDAGLQAVQRALQLDRGFPGAAAARDFVRLVELSLTRGRAKDAAPLIKRVLSGDPKDLPALFLSVQLTATSAAKDTARSSLAQIVKDYPDFAPAAARLASLYAEDPATLDDALRLATKARQALPTDPYAGEVLGIIAFRQAKYDWAVQLLTQSTADDRKSADAFYYLGMSYLKLAKPAEAKEALERAIQIAPDADVASRARQALPGLKPGP